MHNPPLARSYPGVMHRSLMTTELTCSFLSLLPRQDDTGTKVEYRVWNPFRSKLAAAILGGVDNIHIKPGVKVLYLGAASGTTVSHVADIVGPVSVCSCCVLLCVQAVHTRTHTHTTHTTHTHTQAHTFVEELTLNC